MSGKAVREVSGFRVGIEDPHQRQVAQRKRRAHLIDHLVSVVCITANPGHAVRPGDRIVRWHRDSVPRRIDDLYPGRRRLLEVVGELDERRRDTAAMRVFSRALGRWDMLRLAAMGAGVASLALLAAFVVAGITVRPDLASVLAALGALAIGAAGFMYAWREPGA